MNTRTLRSGTPPTLIVPRQRRSRALAERVVAATQRLLRHTDFNSLAMTDVARAAGTSVGSIYTRFPSKERLLCFLADRILFAEPDGAAIKLLEPLEDAPDLRAFLSGYLTGISAIFSRHRAIIGPMSTLARESSDGELRAYLTRVNDTAHFRLREAMARYSAEIRHPMPQVAIDFTLLWMGAAMRERILFAEPVSRPRRASVARFVAELVEAMHGYLTARRANP